MTMRLAAIQMNSGKDIAANLDTTAGLLEQAADAGAQLAVLPENFALMGGRSRLLAAAETDGDGPIQTFVAQTAQRLGLWLVAGTLPLISDDPGRVRPASLVYDADGRCAACYDKIHLFDVGVPGSEEAYFESETFRAGKPTPTVIDTPWGGLGLSVCYDLRFPELYRALVDAGADLITAPSAFTHTTGQAHWHLLTRTRAVENQITLIAPGQVGMHGRQRRTYGHSLIADAWGSVRAEAQTEHDEVVVADFDAGHQAGIRDSFPALEHRKL